MESHVRPPEPLTKDDNMASNWQNWKEEFIRFMNLTGHINKPSKDRADYLKNLIGKVGTEAIQNMFFDNLVDKDDVDILIKKLDEKFSPPKNEVVERYQFFTLKKQNESIEQYINVLKEKAKTCNFNDMTNSIIRDKIVLDTQDKILCTKFLETDNLNLSKLVAIYNNHNTNAVTENYKKQFKNPCWKCGEWHSLGKCPARGSKCTKCGDKDHFSGRCKFSKLKKNDNKSKSNDKLNNLEDAAADKKHSMSEMFSFPDVPTTSFDIVNSPADKNPTFNFVIVNTHETSSNLRNDNTAIHSAHLPKNTPSSHSYTGFKPDGIQETSSKLYIDNITNHSANLPKNAQDSHSYTRFPAKLNETHNTSSKLWNDSTTNHLTNLPKNTQVSQKFGKVPPMGMPPPFRPNTTHNINSKLCNDNTTNRPEPQLSKSTQDIRRVCQSSQTGHISTKLGNDNTTTNHLAHLPKSTQNTSFTVKPDGTHNLNHKLGVYNNTTNQSAYSPNSTQSSNSYADFKVGYNRSTLYKKDENTRKKKKDTCVLS